MDFPHNSVLEYGREKNPKKNNSVIKNIINEYSLKRNIFNPSKKSPNIFLTKLQHRMNIYYSLLKSKD
tara:strand:- start:85 stop:288 length:204 start_codon:yes stop_codon:yes gene_type:complete